MKKKGPHGRDVCAPHVWKRARVQTMPTTSAVQSQQEKKIKGAQAEQTRHKTRYSNGGLAREEAWQTVARATGTEASGTHCPPPPPGDPRDRARD